MSSKTYAMFTAVLSFLLAMFIAVSIIKQTSILLPLGGVIAAILLLRLCRRFVKEIMVDERTRRIDERASAASYRVFTIVMGILALVLIMLRTKLSFEYRIAAETIAYSVCALMLIHLAFRSYYRRKL